MSKHWKPQADGDEPVRKTWHGFNQPKPELPDYLRPAKRLKGLDEFTLPDFVGRPSTAFKTGVTRIRRRNRLPEGAKAGLVLVAAACVGVGVGAYAAFGPREIISADIANDPTTP